MTVALALSIVAAIGAIQDTEADAATSGTPKAPGPSGDSFYVAPSPLPSGQPGDILRWRPFTPLRNVVNADAWEVMYLSTNALGERNAVTSTVMVPKRVDPAKAPIVGFAVGTQGSAFKCASSKSIRRGTLYDQSAINDSISSGFVVAITDYEGYGPHTTPTT